MPDKTRLLVRADDAGSCWASNHGCLNACADGIARSVEVMMPCAWVTDAARLFADRPDIDIGIHLTLTSEWDAMKWRPLTHAPGLVDRSGCFLPLLQDRPNDDRPALSNRQWNIEEITAELRAQIKMGVALFPQASHVSCHMVRHLADFDPRLGDVVAGLCAEFGLVDDPFCHGLPRFSPYPAYPRDSSVRISSFVEALGGLAPGTHVFIDHPAVDCGELSALGHPGYEDVLADRVSCLEALTSPAVRREIDRLGIELISYRDL
ncbi:ChbG/HpnK family deacetylase [Roseibium sp. MMSF_3412]|uniref:ChbG/HpnK family deacetylase n=1 Tax=Roseibium sp. MMSF_3412 TaxID=3046712 RepID=UPI00273DDD9C|nr:ChbG/HpnK family deacetylase [Roseibium sp. MMSF_3412]